MVLWMCFGLVVLALYYANSVSSELRVADNRLNEIAARQAVAGGIRYVSFILSQFAANGAVPRIEDYLAEDVPVGEAAFWIVGRDPNQPAGADPTWGLVDESSKLNLNTANRSMLEMLPPITSELVESILTWRAANPSENAVGAGDETYARLDPPRARKGAPFETVDELRLVYGATLDLLLGDDTNRNGALDFNEDDGEQSPPLDGRDGLLNAGVLEYLTVYSSQPATRSDGSRRINVTNRQSRQRLGSVLQSKLGGQRAGEIIRAIGDQDFNSLAAFMVASRMTADEWVQVRTDLAVSNNAARGLVNVNTASIEVLSCIPGIGPDNAQTIAAYRLTSPDLLTSFHWLTQVLDPGAIRRAGPYITDQAYQFSADIVGVGRNGRGYWRERVVFDMSNGTPRIIYRQNLSAYGWALGAQTRQALAAAKEALQ
jgi:type II secretory pathway component PulK